jgi:hypothetical protein
MHARAFLIGLLLVGAFILGCVSASLVVPPARAGATAQKWEYHCIEEYGAESIAKKANEAGREGWEMVGADSLAKYQSWCFKRPLP